MTEAERPRYHTRQIRSADPGSGFSCGKHALDHFFVRYALANDVAGIGRTYVLPALPEHLTSGLPELLGFYTVSMATVESAEIAKTITGKLPQYPVPVALIGRLAVDKRAHRHGFGEELLIDALQRVCDAAEIVGCIGVIVDAKDEDAERFYAKFDFVAIAADWPRRMFLPMEVIRELFA